MLDVLPPLKEVAEKTEEEWQAAEKYAKRGERILEKAQEEFAEQR